MDAIRGEIEGRDRDPGELVVLPEGIVRDLPPILAGTAPEPDPGPRRALLPRPSPRSSRPGSPAAPASTPSAPTARTSWPSSPSGRSPGPSDATALLQTSVADVHAWRDHLVAAGAAPKTLNRRIASLSSFFKYLQAAAAELRLPITVPNPAHAQFLGREAADPREETRALSATRARQLMGLPAGDTVFDARDRAILKFYLYSGARLAAGCRLHVEDVHHDPDGATVRLNEKGARRRTIGLHFTAAEAIADYVAQAGLTDGPLFRPRKNSRSRKLADTPFDPSTMYRLIMGYLERLPRDARPTRTMTPARSPPAPTRPTRCGPRRPPCSSAPASISARSRSSSATATSPPPRSTTSAASPPPRAPRTTCRSDNTRHNKHRGTIYDRFCDDPYLLIVVNNDGAAPGCICQLP